MQEKKLVGLLEKINNCQSGEISEFRELVSAFDSEIVSVDQKLANLQDCIRAYKLPAKDELDCVTKAIEQLSEKYRKIYSLTKSITASEEVQESDGMESFICAVEQCKHLALQAKVNEAREILSRFCRIVPPSSDPQCIQEHQENAKQALQKLSNVENVDVEPFLEMVNGPKAFLDAFDCAADSEEFFDLLEKARAFFGAKVQFLLSIKKFTESQVVVEEPKPVIEEPKPVIEEPKVAVEEPKPAPAPVVEEPAPVAEAPAPAPAPEDDDVHSVDPISTPPVKKFQGDIRNFCRSKIQCTIIPILSKFCFLNRHQINRVLKSVDNFAISGMQMDEGVKANMYATYEYAGVDGAAIRYYCLTQYCHDGVSKNKTMVKPWLTLSFNQGGLLGTQTIPKAVVDCQIKKNEVLFAYFDQMYESAEKSVFKKIVDGSVRKKDSYGVPVPNEVGFPSCYLLLDASDAANVEYEDVLVVAGAIDIPQVFNSSCKNVYVAKGGKIYKCDPKAGSVSDQVLDYETRPEPVPEPTPEPEPVPELKSTPVQESEPIAKPKVAEDDSVDEAPPPKIDSSVYVDYGTSRTPLDKPTAQQLLDLRCKPEDDELFYVAQNLLTKPSKESVVMQALLLAETASFEKGYEKCKVLSRQIQLATHLFLDKPLKYSEEVVSSAVFGLENTMKEMTLAIYLQGMVTPVPHNYGFKNQVKNGFDNFDEEFSGFQEFKQLYNALLKSLENYDLGFTKQVLNAICSREESKKHLEEIKERAKLSLVPTRSSIITSHNSFATKYLYDPECDMSRLVKWVEEGRQDQNSLDEMRVFLEFYCEDDEISMEKIEAEIETNWKVCFPKSLASHSVKRKFAETFYKRIEVVKDWIDCFGDKSSNLLDVKERTEARNKIVGYVSNLLENKSWKRAGQGNVLEFALNYLKMYLTSNIPENYMLESFSELLKTGCISLEDNGTPILDNEMTEVRYNEPWLYMLRHIVAEKKDFETVCRNIKTYGGQEVYSNQLPMFDSLRQLDMIGRYLKMAPYSNAEEESEAKEMARIEAQKKINDFLKDVELRYTYGQFGEREKEVLFAVVNQYQDQFFEREDFAQWGWFLNGLKEQESWFAVRIGTILKEQLDSKFRALANNPKAEDEGRKVFLEKAKKALDGLNYALAEEYINRYDHRDKVDDYADEQNAESLYFDEFLSSDGIESLIKFCKESHQRDVPVYGMEYLKEHSALDLSAEKSDALVSNWWLDLWTDPLRILKTRNLFDALGFDVLDAEERSKPGDTIKHFSLKVKPVDTSLRVYKHPITNYGTGLSKTNINVICVNRMLPAKDLVSDIFDFCVNKSLRSINTIVLVSFPLDSAYRRNVADLTHTSARSKNPFLLVDVGMMLYLAGLRRNERITAMLQCTLPYSTYQPFCDDNSSSGIGDEMFFGREDEISSLTSENPPCFVYGGRQLGKTTLLLRATNLCHKPEVKEIAVYVDIKHCNTEESFVEKIVQAINSKLRESRVSILPNNCRKISSLKTHIEKHFTDNKMVSLFLLMDEADIYLDSISKDSYSGLEDFIALKRSSHNKFRFVFAGLHNVSRAKNATKNNSLLGQFGSPLCVRPLRYRDASNLLLRPLRYLGFRIAKYPYLDSILANTNYYPGMIQFFGNILVKNTLIDKYTYSASKHNPPFELDRSQLSKVIASEDLNKSIQDKFLMSLQLDDRYLMLAQCITALYHLNDKSNMIWMGFSVDEIKDVADNILCVKLLATEEHYEDLLNEMVDMGILEITDEKYRLRRRAFVDMIGNSLDKIEREVEKANEEYEKNHGK